VLHVSLSLGVFSNSLLLQWPDGIATELFPFSFSLLQRIRMEEIKSDEWFKKGYTPVSLIEYEDLNLDDINAVFDDTEVGATLISTSSSTTSFFRFSQIICMHSWMKI